MLKYYIILLIIFSPLISYGQSVAADTSKSEFKFEPDAGENPIIQDSLQGKNIEDIMNEKPPPEIEYQMSKSPTSAILWTLLFPGAGQIYVESYWKAPIFVAGAGVLAYIAINNHNDFKFFDNDANSIENQIYTLETQLESIPPNDPLYESIQLEIIRNKTTLQSLNKSKEVYRNNRDQSIFFLAGIYILAAVDAYVGAHLFDFSVDDDLSMNFYPTEYKGICLDMKIKF